MLHLSISQISHSLLTGPSCLAPLMGGGGGEVGSANSNMVTKSRGQRSITINFWPCNNAYNIPFLQSSYYRYLSQTSASYTASRVLSLEKISCSSTVQCYADGYDDDTVEQLQHVSQRFGPVASWSSAYRTDSWSLRIERSG